MQSPLLIAYLYLQENYKEFFQSLRAGGNSRAIPVGLYNLILTVGAGSLETVL